MSFFRKRNFLLAIFGFIATFFILVLIKWFIHSEPIRVNKFGVLKVGQEMPSFTAWSYKSGVSFSTTEPTGHFFIHLVNDKLPLSCFDLDCGKTAKKVIDRGGHLIGFSDGKASRGYGIKILKRDPWTFDTSVMAVTDDKAIIIAIYENAYLKDIPKIMEELKL